MPRYFFNVFDGRIDIDPTGAELSGWKDARREAMRVAARIIDDDAESLALGADWHMEVTDERGLILFRLDFHITEAPVLRADRPGV